jgi:hypothetical protein
MPQYNFLCRTHCKSKDMEQRWAAFFAVTSKKS